MNKIILSVTTAFLLVAAHADAKPPVTSYEGFWLYGFETSVFESCDGSRYWMWTPSEFAGEYSMEGYRNPVLVSGYLLPANPDDNMYSTLEELKVIEIKHTDNRC